MKEKFESFKKAVSEHKVTTAVVGVLTVIGIGAVAVTMKNNKTALIDTPSDLVSDAIETVEEVISE